MKLCRVTGTVVSTQKQAPFAGRRLLLVAPVDLAGEALPGKAEDVALDPGLDAGVGDVVLVAKEGAVVAQMFDADGPPTPANVVIVAIVDEWTVEG